MTTTAVPPTPFIPERPFADAPALSPEDMF